MAAGVYSCFQPAHGQRRRPLRSTTGPGDAILALPATRSLQPLAGMLRWIVVAVLTIAVALPLGFILFQSLLTAPFFDANKTLGVEGFRFIFADPDFWSAVKNSFIIAGGMLFISIPLGGILAFLMVRTDLPAAAVGSSRCCSRRCSCRRWCSRSATSSRPARSVSTGLVPAAVRRAGRAVERVLDPRDHGDRRPHARAARVPVLVGGAAHPGSDVEEAARGRAHVRSASRST